MRGSWSVGSAIGLVLLVSAGGIRLAAAQAQDGAAAPRKQDLSRVSWIAGNWCSEEGPSRTEEQWLAPQASTMVGMCRITNGDRLVMYEFMVIEREAEAIVLWMRHYRANLKEREQAPIRWVLSKASDDEVVFDGPAEDRFKNLIYRKTGPDAMTTTLVPRDPAAMKPLEFAFRRAPVVSGKP